MSCSCCIPPADNTPPHAMTPRSHSPYPPQKKIKKNSEKGSAPTWMPPRGGCPPPSMMPHVSRIIKAHTHATRQQYAQRGAMHCQYAARRQTQPVCVRNVRLHGNSAPPINTPANQMPARHSHGTHKAKATHPQGKTAHPKRRRANHAFSFVSRMYINIIYIIRETKKIKSFPAPHSRG